MYWHAFMIDTSTYVQPSDQRDAKVVGLSERILVQIMLWAFADGPNSSPQSCLKIILQLFVEVVVLCFFAALAELHTAFKFRIVKLAIQTFLFPRIQFRMCRPSRSKCSFKFRKDGHMERDIKDWNQLFAGEQLNHSWFLPWSNVLLSFWGEPWQFNLIKLVLWFRYFWLGRL